MSSNSKINKTELLTFCHIAQKLARFVGEKLREVSLLKTPIKVSYKSKSDPVTEWDLWAEETITNGILKEFPNHKIIGEEALSLSSAGPRQSIEETLKNNICWIIDPIDGTSNFASRIPCFTVSIGVVIDGHRSIGVVYDPMHEELFSAVVGQGAQVNQRKLLIDSTRTLADSVFVIESFWDDQIPLDKEKNNRYKNACSGIAKAAKSVRTYGCSTIDQVWITCDRVAGVVAYGPFPWDIAAASLIAEEAGAKAHSFVYQEDGSFDQLAEFSFLCKGLLLCYPSVALEIIENLK